MKKSWPKSSGAREANVNSNKQEMMNFLKTCEEPPVIDESSEHKRCVKLFRHMKTTVQPSTVSRSIHRITKVIFDTGNSGNDMPEKIVTEIGCATIRSSTCQSTLCLDNITATR